MKPKRMQRWWIPAVVAGMALGAMPALADDLEARAGGNVIAHQATSTGTGDHRYYLDDPARSLTAAEPARVTVYESSATPCPDTVFVHRYVEPLPPPIVLPLYEPGYTRVIVRHYRPYYHRVYVPPYRYGHFGFGYRHHGFSIRIHLGGKRYFAYRGRFCR